MDDDDERELLAPAAEPPPAPRHKRRSKPRSKTIAPKRLSKAEREGIEAAASTLMLHASDRPRDRLDCDLMDRPCPWVSCKHHLYLDVNPETGSIKLNFPDLEPWELTETCVLDVADRGGVTLEEVGAIMNLTRERVRQVEVRGLLKLKMAGPGEEPLPGDSGYYVDDGS